MPPKRRGRHSLKKKCQIIRTRLIEISLKVEDLIYHKTPISEAEAEIFINEVISYQVECSQDERSLQVIEKLMRCMKAIIVEHQERRLNNDNTYDGSCHLDNGSSSPVYSLPDEDKTQLSQESGEVLTSVNLNTNEEVTNLQNCCTYFFNETEFQRDRQIHDVASNDTAVSNIVNHCNKNSFIAPIDSTKNIGTADVKIHKALSNLSLKNVAQHEIMSTDIESSQSILKNFHEIDNSDQNNTPNVEYTNRKYICDALEAIETGDVQTKTQDPVMEISTNLVTVTDLSQLTKAGFLEDTPKHVKAAENVKKTFIVPKQPMRSTSNLNNTYNSTKSADYIKIISVQNVAYNDLNSRISTNTLKETGLKSTPGAFNKKVEDTNINVIPYNSSERHNNITNFMKNSIIKNKVPENITNKNSVPALKKTRNPRKKKVTESKERTDNKIAKSLVDKKSNDTENKIINPSKRTINSKKKVSNKHATVPIYNKNIENDLSWMESIRFVREIGEDEYDGNLTNLNEHFWDNYYLPPNFDDGDFL